MSIIDVCKRGDVEGLRRLLKANCDVDKQDKYGNTGFIWACSNGHKEIVAMLLKANCNIDKQNKYGDTGLIEACCYGHKDIIAILLEANCDTEKQNNNGDTGLMEACYEGHKDSIIKLVEYGCEINIPQKHKEKYKEEINKGLQLKRLRIGLFGTSIEFVKKNINIYSNKICILPFDIRKHFKDMQKN